MVSAVMLACATSRGAPPNPTSDEPPPRGAPSPRTGDLPPPSPGHASETEDLQRRFPILEAQQRKEHAQRAAQAAAASGHVDVQGNQINQACQNLTPEERLECPLHDPRAAASIADTAKGVRVSLRPGGVSPEKLEAMFNCQKSLAVARPQAPTACPFIDSQTDARVSARSDRIDVELQRAENTDLLRQQVRTALAPKR
jgi:hypothetical protein